MRLVNAARRFSISATGHMFIHSLSIELCEFSLARITPEPALHPNLRFLPHDSAGFSSDSATGHQKTASLGLPFFYPSRRLGISSRRSRGYHQGRHAALVSHHAPACISLQLDEIQHFVLMISNFCEIDDIHGFAVIESCPSPTKKREPPLGDLL